MIIITIITIITIISTITIKIIIRKIVRKMAEAPRAFRSFRLFSFNARLRSFLFSSLRISCTWKIKRDEETGINASTLARMISAYILLFICRRSKKKKDKREREKRANDFLAETSTHPTDYASLAAFFNLTPLLFPPVFPFSFFHATFAQFVTKITRYFNFVFLFFLFFFREREGEGRGKRAYRSHKSNFMKRRSKGEGN